MTRQHTVPFFHDVEPVHPIRDDILNVYTTEQRPSQRRPAVVLVHGGPVPADQEPGPRDWEGFTGYAALLAQAGLVAVTFNHRLYSDMHYPESADDLDAAVNQTRRLPMVNPERIGLWLFSGGGALSASWLREPPSWLRAVAFSYPALAPPPNWPGDGPRFDAVAAVGTSPELPKLLIRVGREIEFLASTQDDFVAAAKKAGADLQVIEIPHAEHAFEQDSYDPRSRYFMAQAIDWLSGTLCRETLGPLDEPPR